MTSAAIVLPDAAVRMPRAVAGRHALQVVLLLAGLLALGFLCGERAHAVEGVPAPERVESARTAGSVQPVRERVAEPAREPVRESVREGHEVVRDGRRAVRDVAVQPVADAVEPVVRSARGAVRPVVDGATGVLEDAPQRVLPEAPDLPDLPGLTRVPGTPDLPGMPGMPELPQSGLGQGAGGGDDAGAGTGAERPAPHAGRGEVTARAHDARAASTYGTGTAAGVGGTCTAGQQAGGGALFAGGSADYAHRAGNAPFPTPLVPLAPPAPPGDTGRTLGGQSAGDGSSTRHGDPCTASYGSRAPVRQLHGAGAVQVSAPVRERHRDILEFPG